MYSYKSKGLQMILLGSMLLIALNSGEVINAVQNSMRLCFSSVIPALYPFMILSSVFVSTINESSFKTLCKITGSLFGISSYGTGALICGIICGYPIGPRCACELYTDKKISAQEAESLIAYSNNCGPLFVIGVVGYAMLNSVKHGVILYIIQLICCFMSAFILKPYTYSKIRFGKTNAKIKSFTNAICDSTYTVLIVCGYIIFFGAVGVFVNRFSVVFPVWLRCIINSIPEITNAIAYITQTDLDYEIKLSLISMALGWCGISVHMQVKSIVSKAKLSMKKYYIIKVFSSLTSGITAYLVFGGLDSIVLINPHLTIGLISLVVSSIILFIIYTQKKRGYTPLFFKN